MPEIEIGGVRTYYEDEGSGPPLVLVHGLGGSTRLWKEVAGDLARDFRVVAYDLRGSGASAVPEGPYSLEQLVGDLDALVEGLGLGRVFLVGHSLGGTVVLRYAADHPGKVLAVVGLGALAELPEQAREGMKTRAATVEAAGMAAVAETVARNGTAPPFQEEHPEELAWFVELLSANDPRGYAALCRVVAAIDITGDLGRITAPVLLLAGDRDGVAPPTASQASADAISDARFEELHECGHISPLERPGRLLESISAFLRRIPAA